MNIESMNQFSSSGAFFGIQWFWFNITKQNKLLATLLFTSIESIHWLIRMAHRYALDYSLLLFFNGNLISYKIWHFTSAQLIKVRATEDYYLQAHNSRQRLPSATKYALQTIYPQYYCPCLYSQCWHSMNQTRFRINIVNGLKSQFHIDSLLFEYDNWKRTKIDNGFFFRSGSHLELHEPVLKLISLNKNCTLCTLWNESSLFLFFLEDLIAWAGCYWHF